MKRQLQILTLMFKYLALATFVLALILTLYYLWLTWNTPQAHYSIFIRLAPTAAIQEDLPR